MKDVKQPLNFVSWHPCHHSTIFLKLFVMKCRVVHSNYFPSEVITYNQWIHLKPEPKSMFPGWIKSAWRGGNKEMQESMDQKLHFVLNTAPMWDRLVCTHIFDELLIA